MESVAFDGNQVTKNYQKSPNLIFYQIVATALKNKLLWLLKACHLTCYIEP